jgi:rhodanese-related sulfurtransferase
MRLRVIAPSYLKFAFHNPPVMQTITVEELKSKLESGEQVHLVDVREPSEHAEFNIGGLLLPLGKVQTMQVDEIDDLRDETVYLYCRSGNRSGQACLILETMGFKNVVNVTGGMLAWQERIAK